MAHIKVANWSSALPTDSYTWQDSLTPTYVELARYGRGLYLIDVFACLAKAEWELEVYVKTGQTHKPIGEFTLQYTFGSVTFVLHPFEDMTWWYWSATLRKIMTFLSRYDCVQFSYNVWDIGTQWLWLFVSIGLKFL